MKNPFQIFKSIFFLYMYFSLLQIKIFAQTQWYSILDKPMNELKINSKNQMFGISDDGLYRSTDKGEFWTHLNTGSNKFISCISFNSNDDIFIGIDSGVFRSTDNGDNWEGITGNLSKNLNVRRITINKDNFIFIGTNDGVYRSTNNGMTWQLCGGVYRTYILSTVKNSKDHIFFSTIMSTGGGIFRSTDKGSTWAKVMEGNANYLSIAVDSTDYIYTQGQFTGIFKSIDNGESWSENSNFPFTISRELFVSDSDYIFAATERGVFVSKNEAKTWYNITGNLKDLIITSIAVNVKGEIFACTENGVFKCGSFFIDLETDYFPLDVGNYWQFEITNLFGNPPVTGTHYDYMRVIKDTLIGENSIPYKKLKSFIIPPYYPDTIMYLRYDSLSELIFKYDVWSGYEDTLFKLNAAVGENWEEGGPTINCSDIGGVQIFNEDKLFKIFSAGTRPWYYYKLSQGFGPIEIFDDDSYVLTNTYMYNLIYTRIKGLEYGQYVALRDENINVLINYHLSQNYPNPFNPVTRIKYSIPKKSFVNIKVYDILGKEAAILVNEEKNSGNYEVEFNAADLASGIYFYKLQTEDYSDVREMILLK